MFHELSTYFADQCRKIPDSLSRTFDPSPKKAAYVFPISKAAPRPMRTKISCKLPWSELVAMDDAEIKFRPCKTGIPATRMAGRHL